MSDQRLHDLRGTLNGIGLQLEVLALAFARRDDALHARALDLAREAIATAAAELERLRERTPG